MPGPGIRGMVLDISPTWLLEENAGKFNFAVSVSNDALIQKMLEAIRARMPTEATATALALIGQDRLIPQGLTESDANYRLRLQRAFDDWQIAGNPWSVLRQVLGYLLEEQPGVATVSAKYSALGVLQADIWNYYDAAAPCDVAPTRVRDNVSPAWDWDSLSPNQGSWGWFRWWLVIRSIAPQDVFGPAPFVFGDPGINIGEVPDASVGLNVAPSVIGNLRSIVKQWKGAHAVLSCLIVSFDAALFDPAQPSGGGVNPDGYFGRWSKVVNGEYVPSRFADARYCTGV